LLDSAIPRYVFLTGPGAFQRGGCASSVSRSLKHSRHNWGLIVSRCRLYAADRVWWRSIRKSPAAGCARLSPGHYSSLTP